MSNYELSPDKGEQYVKEKAQERPVLLNFWAPWCQVNEDFRPRLESAAQQYGVELIHVDVSENDTVARCFDVRGVPDVKLLDEDGVVDGFSGALPEMRIHEFIEENLGREVVSVPKTQQKSTPKQSR